MDCSMPGFPVLHYLLELAQTHVHRVSEAIQPYHRLLLLPLIFPSIRSFPQRLSSEEFTCNAGDLGLIPGSGRSPEGGNGNPI